jgi:hypothetical protein
MMSWVNCSFTALERRLIVVTPVLVILLALMAYFPAVDNFFTWDDFLWLQRSATLFQNPAQILQVDVIYFDPLVYLSFWLNYLLAPFDYRWYHAVDIAIHAANGLLIWHLVRRLTSDHHAAIASSLIFTVSFATVDAVVWSSSRVDLISVFFSLLALIAYQSYLADKTKQSLIFSVVAYILALAAKGTPVVILPVIIFMLAQNNVVKQLWRSLIPFVLITGVYLSALIVKLAGVDKGLSQTGTMMPNIKNLIMSFAGLFVPERFVAQGLYASFVIAALLVAFIACFGGAVPLRRTRILGLAIIVAGLLPVIVLKEFKLSTTINNAGYLLNSPSHRIYLASVGMAIFYGALFGEVTRRTRWKLVGYTLFSLLIVWSMYEIRLREKLWAGSARYISASVEGLAKFKGKIHENSAVGLVNFPMSRGFMRPVMFLYCGVENVLLLPMGHIPEDVPDDPELLRYQNRGYFFVYSDRVHDLSAQFSHLLGAAFRYQVATDPITRVEALSEYQLKAREINSAIADVKYGVFN